MYMEEQQEDLEIRLPGLSTPYRPAFKGRWTEDW